MWYGRLVGRISRWWSYMMVGENEGTGMLEQAGIVRALQDRQVGIKTGVRDQVEAPTTSLSLSPSFPPLLFYPFRSLFSLSSLFLLFLLSFFFSSPVLLSPLLNLTSPQFFSLPLHSARVCACVRAFMHVYRLGMCMCVRVCIERMHTRARVFIFT